LPEAAKAVAYTVVKLKSEEHTISTSLQRAKNFLAAKASRLALAVVPLAAIAVSAVPAHAGSIVVSGFSYNSCSVSDGGSGTCTITQANSTGSVTSLNALQLAGTGSTSSGSLSFGVTSAGAAGTVPGGNLPVSWYFQITDPNSDVIDWSIVAEVSTSSPSGSHLINPSGSVSSTGWVQSSGNISLPSGTINGYELELNLNDVTHPGGTFSVNIPAGSTIDFNNTNTAGSGTPEPASLLLAGGGLASLAFLRRRKKKA
jgi:hypothetical protein